MAYIDWNLWLHSRIKASGIVWFSIIVYISIWFPTKSLIYLQYLNKLSSWISLTMMSTASRKKNSNQTKEMGKESLERILLAGMSFSWGTNSKEESDSVVSNIQARFKLMLSLMPSRGKISYAKLNLGWVKLPSLLFLSSTSWCPAKMENMILILALLLAIQEN